MPTDNLNLIHSRQTTYNNNRFCYRLMTIGKFWIKSTLTTMLFLLAIFYLFNIHLSAYGQAESNVSADPEGVKPKGNNFLVYHNDTSGITVSYPSNWTILQPSGNTTFALSNVNGGQFSIIFDKLMEGNLEQHAIKYIRDKNDSLSIYSPIMYKPFEIIEFDRNYTIGGNPAFKLVYTLPCMPDLAKCAVLDIGTINKGNVYHVIYQTPPPITDLQLDPAISLVMHMVESFKVNVK